MTLPVHATMLLAAITLMAAPQSASGQASPTATGPGSSLRTGVGIADYEIDYGKRAVGGGQLWVDVNPSWRLGLEGEARWLRYFRDPNGARQSTFLVGPRLSLTPGPVEPYVKLLAGRGVFEFPFGYAHGSYFALAGGAGIDIHRDRWQLRVIDFEYQRWPSFSYGPLRPYGISVGLGYTWTQSPTKIGR